MTNFLPSTDAKIVSTFWSRFFREVVRSANGESTTNSRHYLQALSRGGCVNRDIWPRLKIDRWQITGGTQKSLNQIYLSFNGVNTFPRFPTTLCLRGNALQTILYVCISRENAFNEFHPRLRGRKERRKFNREHVVPIHGHDEYRFIDALKFYSRWYFQCVVEFWVFYRVIELYPGMEICLTFRRKKERKEIKMISFRWVIRWSKSIYSDDFAFRKLVLPSFFLDRRRK